MAVGKNSSIIPSKYLNTLLIFIKCKGGSSATKNPSMDESVSISKENELYYFYLSIILNQKSNLFFE